MRKRMFKDMPDFDKKLKELYVDKGMTMKEVAAVFGCTASAICLQLKRCEIKARNTHDYPPTDKFREAWVKIGKQAAGRSHSDVAKQKISAAKSGYRKSDNYEFGGHEKLRRDGYVKVYAPEHPNCTTDGYVMKHTLVMEKQIGRYLTENEVVHHINRIRNDNRIENLHLMTFKEHAELHMTERHAERRQKSVK